MSDEHGNTGMSEDYRAQRRADLGEAMSQTHGLFKGCHNLLGPLGKDAQKDILSYINEPTPEKWEAIYTKMITPLHTLWQAWAAIDSQAPISVPSDGPWPNTPSGDTLIRAIRHAVERLDEEV